MKYFNLTKNIAVIAVVSLLFMACKKAKVSTPMGDVGQTLVKILNGGTPASVAPRPIDFISTPSRILAVELRRDIPNETELNKTMVVTVRDDTAAVRTTNPAYIQFPPAWFTLDMDGVKTGGQGGTFTFTFKPGQFSKSIYVIIPNATLLNPSALYGLGFTILTADAGGKISTQKSIVVEIGAKNIYDGIYGVVSGFVQRYASPGVPEAPGGLNGPLGPANPDVVLATTSANCVDPIGVTTPVGFTWASFGGIGGIDGLKICVDPVTNLTTMTSVLNATLTNWAGHVNKYDPATKTFTLAFRWNPASTTREYEVVIKYKGPR